MIFAVIALFLVGSLVPGLWVRQSMARHAQPRADLPGTGGQLAQHLLDRFGLRDVSVQSLPAQLARDARINYYDPDRRQVLLAPAIHDGRSLTAVAIAAHEVGHALQHAHGDSLFSLRTGLVRLVQPLQRLGALAFLLLPFLGLLTRSPQIALLIFLLALLSMLAAVLVQLITLPVEWDASFGKALPILREGQYITQTDEPAVRNLLRAAALTYLAAALMSLLNVGWWLRLLR